MSATSRHIALVTPSYPPGIGGLSRLALEISSGLSAAGHFVTVICESPGPPSDRAASSTPDVRHLPAPASRAIGWLLAVPLLRQLIQSFRILRMLVAINRERKIDIVEFSNWNCAGAVHSLFKVAPQVIRLSTSINQIEPGGATPLGRAVDSLVTKLLGALERRCVIWSDGIITHSRAHLDEMAEQMSLPVRLVEHAVIAMPPVPRRAGFHAPLRQHDRVRLLFVGRLTHRKGFDLLMTSVSILNARNLTCFDLHLVGDDARASNGTPSAWADWTENSDPDVRSRVTYLGTVDDERLGQEYAGADIIVMPSRYESYGLVLLEAMEMGLPVVACAAGGPMEIVEHGETGLLVEPDCSPALADALQTLIEDGELRRRMALAARRRSKTRFSREAFIEATIRLYQSVHDSGTSDAMRLD
jgi:glycosyltransferase involved in cell wall biosynthesis